MKKILLLSNLLLSFLLNAQVTGNSQEVGVTDGQLSVSLTGAATYNIPILVPSGINGVEPKVSLVYNSQSGNGIAGYGWNISGVSAITRIPATKFHDNTIDGVDFDQYDRFALDGQRLILKTGTYGGNGAVYETENYSNLKIISYGVSPYGANFGPNYFKVFYPDGSKATFGTSNDSKTKSVWGITRWYNPQDLRISYQYINFDGSLHLENIKYGSKGDVTGINRVNFHYHGRSRKEESYINGSRHLNNRILKKITTYSGTNTFRIYQLHHDNTSLNYERLIKITEKNASFISLNPTIFTYEDSNNSDLFERTVTNIGLNNVKYSNTGSISGDFNEDGKMDMITYKTSGSNPRESFTLFTSVSNGNFTNGITYSFGNSNHGFKSLHPAKILFGNKLRNGWIGIDNYSWGQGGVNFSKFVYVSGQIIQVGNTSSSLGSGSGKKVVITGDFNGNSITDLITFKNYYDTDVWFSQTNTNGVSSHIGNINEILSPGPYANPVPFRIYTGDYNGDGKTDIYILRENKLKVYSLNQQNNSLIRIATIYDNDIDLNKPCLMGDFNGDGKTDFVIPETLYQDSWNFYFSNSNNTFIKKSGSIGLNFAENYNGNAYDSCYSNGGRYFAAKINRFFFSTDINNDGKTDIIYFSNTVLWNSGNNVSSVIKIAKNMGTNSHTINFQTNSTTASVFCYTGIKEKPIPIVLDNTEVNQSLEFAVISGNKIHRFKNTQNHQQDVLLREITNGNGVKEKINYSPLIAYKIENNIPIYNKPSISNINYPYVSIGSTPSFQVVSKLEKHGGPYSNSPYSKQIFSYYEAISNVQGLGFIGFSKVLKTNWFNDDYPLISNVSWYDYLKRGAVTNSFSKLDNGYLFLWNLSTPGSNFINKTENTYTSTLSTSKVFKIKSTNSKSYNGLQNTSVENIATYDQYNNILTNTLLTKENGTTIKTEVNTFEYEHNPTGNNLNNPYYIGKLNKKINTSNLNGDVFTSESQFEYNNQLLLTKKKVKGNNTPFITDTFTYDVYGNILTKEVSTPNLPVRTSSFEYDSTGRFIIKSIDIEGLETNFTYDYNGKLLTKTNPYNLTTTYQYDTWGKLIKEIDFLGNEKSIVYSKSGSGYNGKSTITVTNPDGSKLFKLLDPLGRVYYQRSYGYSELWVSTRTHYDIYDRVLKTSEPHDINSPPHQYQYNFNTYDVYGRKTQIALFNGKTTDISYNGLTTTATDGYKTVTTTKNALGQVVEMIDDGGTIQYEYYANGKLKQTNFDGNITSMEYDGWGKKTKLIDTSAGEYTYEYNDFGEIIKETTPNGETNYIYSNIGKLSQKHVTGSGTNLLSNYHYNNTTKLLTSITSNQNTTYTYQYDNYKRLNKTIEQSNDFVYENTTTYDNLSRTNTERKKTIYLLNNTTSDVTTKNIYKNGALWKILNNSNQNVLWQLNTVNARGQVKEFIFGNDIKESTSYDDYGLITNIKTLNSTNNTLIQLDYNFDQQRGLLLSRSNSLFNFNENFAYDDLNRLTSFTKINGQQQTQTYDSKGRIKKNNIGTHYYNSAKPYQLTTVKLTGYGQNHYQDRPLQMVTYNAFKAPTNITEDGYDRMYFYYNIFQQRTKTIYDRQGGGVYNKEKYFTFDGNVEIKRNNNLDQTEILTFIGGDGYSAPIIYKSNGTTNSFEYLHRDNQGTIIAVSNQQANLIEKRAFDAWGNIAHVTDEQDNNLTELTVIDRGYTGHEHLANVALINMNARLYDAKLHRFLAPDNFVQDIFNTQNYNRYSYVLNNPLSFVDPSGEIPILAAALIGAAVSVLTNGIVNSINDQPFFQGALWAAATGAFGGIAANSIGNIANGMKGFSKFAFQTLAHAHLGGVMSGLNGGQYIHGFISGGAGSMISSAAGSALSGVKSSYLQAGGIVFSGAIAGGVASEISGGKFWDGFRNGLISAGLNHAAHYSYAKYKFKQDIRRMLIKAKYPVYGKPTYTIKYIKDMINKIPYLKMFWEKGGKPDYFWEGGDYVGLTFKGKVYFNAMWIDSNYQLLSTAFHEFYHSFQYYSGATAIIEKEYGSITKLSFSRTLVELGAYSFQISLGDTNAQYGLNKYIRRYNIQKQFHP